MSAAQSGIKDVQLARATAVGRPAGGSSNSAPPAPSASSTRTAAHVKSAPAVHVRAGRAGLVRCMVKCMWRRRHVMPKCRVWRQAPLWVSRRDAPLASSQKYTIAIVSQIPASANPASSSTRSAQSLLVPTIRTQTRMAWQVARSRMQASTTVAATAAHSQLGDFKRSQCEVQLDRLWPVLL